MLTQKWPFWAHFSHLIDFNGILIQFFLTKNKFDKIKNQ